MDDTKQSAGIAHSDLSAKLPSAVTKDAALLYLQEHKTEDNQFLHRDEAFMRTLKRKIDLRVILFLMFCYVMNFLDKILLNYGNVMGLAKSLHLKGNNFADAGSTSSSPFFVSPYPMRIPAAKFLSFTLFAWGIATACVAAAKGYNSLIAARVFCGIFESGIPPSLMLMSSQWYTRREQSSRFALWYLGIGLGQVLGGLISWAFQHVSPKASIESWRLMFILIGLITLVVAITIFLMVPDTPMAARFLTPDEKVALLEYVKESQTGIENTHFSWAQIFEALLDPQVLGLFAIIFLQGTGGGVITTFSATIIKSYGYTSRRTALLNMGSGAVTMTSTLICGYGVRFLGHRWFFIILMTIPSLIGAALMAWLPHSQQSGALAGVYLVNTFVGSTPIIYQWLTANVAGHTKRTFASVLINMGFAAGNIIGPKTFRAQDAPEYHTAKVSMVATQSAVVVVCLLLMVFYSLKNIRRARTQYAVDETSDSAEIADEKAYAGQTDGVNKAFVYVL
ncbi:putative MFS transporter [Aureobasidium pullulans]|uniref:Putative MFS transporter n=1 Tax=Aureobasidium pullulans TaxID=5580 RepID=A0A4S8XAE1_AURPU|nr:putative MFS transporter [Aureobasidium pullulans]